MFIFAEPEGDQTTLNDHDCEALDFAEQRLDVADTDKDAPGLPASLIHKSKKLPHIKMFNANGDIVPGWLASPMDIFAKDWKIFGWKNEE